MKKVGVILRSFEENDKQFMGTRVDLFNTLNKYDVIITGIPITMNFDKIKDIVDSCDGIILSGGDEPIENDFKLIEYLYENDKKTLGICLGMQSMGKYFNGLREVKVDNHHSLNEYVHDVSIKENSLLYKIIGKNKIRVNSRHHSAIPETDISVSAISEDGVIEAVEDNSKRFFLGVEWHPESLIDEHSQKLFDYFISIL